MPRKKNILIVEDSRQDFVLVAKHLEREGLDANCFQVSSREQLESCLKQEPWDLMLMDYKLPGMPFQETLDTVQQHSRELPVIVISGTVGEEKAVELLKLGVSDFVLKNNLGRLLPSIERSLREVEERAEKQRVEAKLREQANLLDEANDAIIVRSLDDRILYWNKAAERQYGWKAEEVLGKYVVDVLYSVSKLNFEEALAILMKEGDFSGRITHSRKDGTKVIVQSHWILVRDEAGLPKSILAIHTDLTERLELEERLFQAQKLESLGKLTGGIAHDFNNLLTVIIGNAGLLEEALQESEELLEYVNLIFSAGERAADLTNRLLAFARQQALEPQVFQPEKIILSMRNLLQSAVGENIRLSISAPEDSWKVTADPAKFESAVLNLCINARDAMPHGGHLTIAVENVNLDQDYVNTYPEARCGSYVLITVADNGTGMSPEVLSRAFEPFFTTKTVGKGSGLGLSMVHGFVMQSHGHVRIDSEVGRGTEVRLYLPKAIAEQGDGEEPAIEEEGLGGTEHILLVEDDELVRAYGTNVLRKLGYKVTTAQNGDEAYIMLKDGLACDLLFTDVVMPGRLSGPRLALEAQQLHPDLPVLFTSGYTTEAVMPQGDSAPGRYLLHKPYDKNTLAWRVRSLLNKKADQHK